MSASRLALATAVSARGYDPDEPLLLAALARLGVGADVVAWDDPSAAWAEFDLVVLRSTWDYVERLAEFLAWLDAAGAVTCVANPVPIVRWSLDKHYLADLADAGVPVVPTTFVEVGTAFVPPRSAEPPDDYVLKPAVGAGSRDAARYRIGVEADEAAAVAHVRRLHAGGRAVLFQPYQASVDTEGEAPMVYIGGRFSHAAAKRVALSRAGSMVPGLFAPEDNRPHEPDAPSRRVADAAIAAIPAVLGQPLYGRVDLVRGEDGNPCVLELELAEPSLFLPQGGAAAAVRLASAIIEALGAARGSGPV